MSLPVIPHSLAGRILFRQQRWLCYLVARAHGLYLYALNRGGARSEIASLVQRALGVGSLRANHIACQASITSSKCFFDSSMLMYGDTTKLRKWNSRNGFEGLEHFNRAAATGRGVIIAASNFACFYYAMMTSIPQDMLTNGKPFTLIRPRLNTADPLFERLCAKITEVSGRTFSFIETGGQRAAIDFICALRAQSVVMCMIDYIDTDTLTIPATFFGQPSCLPGGYLLIAERTGAPIVPCHTRYQDGQFVTFFGAPIYPTQCMNEEPALWLAQMVNTRLEQEVRKTPGNWAAWGSVRMKWDLGRQITPLG